MVDLSEDELFRVERNIIWQCEQVLEVDGWMLTWFVSASNRMLVEKQACQPISESEREAELAIVRRYLIDVLKMTPVDVESAIELYEENVGGDMPYVSGIEVAIDGATVIEMYLREHPDDASALNKGGASENPASDIISIGGAV